MPRDTAGLVIEAQAPDSGQCTSTQTTISPRKPRPRCGRHQRHIRRKPSPQRILRHRPFQRWHNHQQRQLRKLAASRRNLRQQFSNNRIRKTRLGKGLAFLNDEGTVLMVLSRMATFSLRAKSKTVTITAKEKQGEKLMKSI